LVLDGQAFRFKGLNLYNINGRGDCGYYIPSLDTELNAIDSAANVVRGWFFQYEATNHTTKARDWSKFDATLATLRARGLHVVVTLADQWGACEAAASRTQLTLGWYQSGYTTVPYDADVTNSYRGWVQEIVTRYRDDPTILTWQLMNEAAAVSDASGSCPNQDTAEAALQAWATDMANLIKSIDPNHLVNVGTSGSSQCGLTGARYAAVHSAASIDLCESHDYTAPSVAISDGVRYEIAACNGLGKPIFVGEVGIYGGNVGCSLTTRAADYDAKFSAQFSAGMRGELVWAWRSAGDGGSNACGFDIGPGDPTLAVLANY
jgi:endo-1,4-beta-mannosidase